MKKILYYVILLLITSMVTSCGKGAKNDNTGASTDEKPQDALFDEVMAIHDEVMPKMGDIIKLKGQLRERIDSTNQSESLRKQRLEQAIKDLEEADEAMMQWMRNFQPQDTVSDQEKVINYYKLQKKEIQKVKEKMLGAIEEARKILHMSHQP